MNMMTRWAAFVSMGLLSLGCSSSAEGLGAGDPGAGGAGGSGGAGGGGGSGGAGAGGGTGGSVQGHALTLTANLVQQAGELSFLTPTVALVKIPASSVVGKPYLVSAFPAGFSPGNDPPIHHFWGTVPADLKIQYTTPSTYKNGPYDMVLAVYVNTPITDAIRTGPVAQAPATKGGDLATFTFDMGAVRPGEPGIPPGLIRFNVEGSDARVTVENKVATDPAQIPAAITNTVMLIP
jgi:hypothetical protein